MLTQDQINSIRTRTGIAAPPDQTVQNRTSELDSRWGNAAAPTPEQPSGGGFGNTVAEGGKALYQGLAKPVVTSLVRPVQAAQSLGQYLGSNTEELSKISREGDETNLKLIKATREKKARGEDTTHEEMVLKKILGEGNPALKELTEQANPNFDINVPTIGKIKGNPTKGEVVGDALQTVALGLGPVAGGSMYGAGDAFSNDRGLLAGTAETIAGALGGKVAKFGVEKVLAPLVGKVAPQVLKDVTAILAKKYTTAAEKVMSPKIMPEVASKIINTGAAKLETAADRAAGIALKPITAPAKVVRNITVGRTPADIVEKRMEALTKLEGNNKVIRRATSRAEDLGIDSKKILAETDLLHGAVDDSGTIRTTQEGGAINQLTDFIEPQETVIRSNLVKEGKKIPLAMVEKELKTTINQGKFKGAGKTNALSKVSKEIEGLALDADKDGFISLADVHDAKVYKYANIDYSIPESKTTDKAIAKTFKTLVEKNTKSVDVQALNRELSQHYAVLNLLEKLDGKKVEGGRLGKYFARTVGSIVGSHFGPLGTIAGAEAGARISGKAMSRTFGGKVGQNLESSPAMVEAIAKGKPNPAIEVPPGGYSKSPGNLNQSQAATIKNTSTDIPKTVPQNQNNTRAVINSTDAAINNTSSRTIDDSLAQYKKPDIGKGKQGGFVKIGGKEIRKFSDFHVDDQEFLVKFADRVNAGEPITLHDQKLVREIFDQYGFRVPESKTKIAEIITTAHSSITRNALDKEMSGNMNRIYGGIGGPETGEALSYTEASRMASRLFDQGKKYPEIVELLKKSGADAKTISSATGPYQ